jgi:glyoxylase-like metal-dependent hydrolase (beta-lactamase superfamily II)
MAEPPATTPAAAATGERDVLLATKLHIPRTRPGFVPRPRLLEQLDQGMDRELVLVCTPAGFGKTSLLADWARRSQRPVAWLSLDEVDNDPARFWRHAAAALDTVRPGVAQQVAVLLGGGLQPTWFEAVVTTLVNQLAGVAEETVLVLDDYHLIQAPQVHQSFGFLLAHLPASLRLVVASRADPPLPLARLRARGQLVELREHDLRFTPAEAAELLHAAVGPELPEAAVAALTDRTEGWAAGLQLAALSLQGRGDIAAFVAGFSGSHRYVLDYLTEEVLDRQPEQLRTFLLETSILERLSGPLCDAVTGRRDGQALLEQVERANLFLQPLDEERRWWRYHQLFADLLRARLHQQRPERVPELHRAAAAWFEAHGLAEEAVRHALAAGEAAWVARLMERHFPGLLWVSEDTTLSRWLAELPASVVREPWLCVALASRAAMGGRLEEAERLLAAAERAPAGAAGTQGPPAGTPVRLAEDLPSVIAMYRANFARIHGDAGPATRFAHRAQAELAGDDPLTRAVVEWNLAQADLLGGRLEGVAMAFFALFGSVFLLTQHLQFVLGYTPLQAGVGVLPVAALVVAAPLAARLTERVGTKLVVAAGLLIVGGALWLLSTVQLGDGYGAVAATLALLGCGMGLTVAPATESIMGALPLAKAGVGSAMNDTPGGALVLLDCLPVTVTVPRDGGPYRVDARTAHGRSTIDVPHRPRRPQCHHRPHQQRQHHDPPSRRLAPSPRRTTAPTGQEPAVTPPFRGTPAPAGRRPQPLHELAPGLALVRGGPGRTLNVYLLGDVVEDSGVRWSRRRLARQLAGRRLGAHLLSHAHFDHAGCSAWLCHTLGVPLWCGAGGTAAIGSGRVDRHRSAWVNRLQRTLAPVAAHPVSRTLEEGEVVGGFQVLEVPGHSPGVGVVAGSGTGCFSAATCWPTSVCIPGSPGWCWRRWRCRGTPRPTGARLVAWPGCGRGWPASGMALRSPTRTGSPPRSTSSRRRPRSDPHCQRTGIPYKQATAPQRTASRCGPTHPEAPRRRRTQACTHAVLSWRLRLVSSSGIGGVVVAALRLTHRLNASIPRDLLVGPRPPRRSRPKPGLQLGVVACQRQVVDLAGQPPLRAGLQLTGHHRAAQQHRPAVLMQRSHQPQPQPAELPVLIGGIQLVGQPQQVLLQHHALLQTPRQDRCDRRLAGSAGTGQRQQRQPGEPPPVAACRADQHRLVGGHGEVVGPPPAGRADVEVHPGSMEPQERRGSYVQQHQGHHCLTRHWTSCARAVSVRRSGFQGFHPVFHLRVMWPRGPVPTVASSAEAWLLGSLSLVPCRFGLAGDRECPRRGRDRARKEEPTASAPRVASTQR